MRRILPLEIIVPGLTLTRWQEKSLQDYHYNCIAFAAGDERQWWEPSGDPLHYWPPGIPREYSLPAYKLAYELFGYRECDFSDKFEKGYQKVAIFLYSDGTPSHAARQTEKGKWLSKLGELEDIEHDSIFALEGDDPNYGKISAFMKRPRPDWNAGCVPSLLLRRDT
jgi:hypothetical protein